MLFSWISDHTISRFGRRKPYLFIAALFIVAMVVLFPFVGGVSGGVWLLVMLPAAFELAI